ncbi:hypothetical protein HMI54_015752 [Coelomomyces lativittatus]|nr:hypothetical protein HMI56_006316 [Coelomomyces lativittatus]KAJ1512384.1 hypothetical protein HMI54_015752 [Coelomomyces lativittatus]KAJ1516705.1 hypothetical protein HMI55_001611 [Coelomomyces lativittatus]
MDPKFLSTSAPPSSQVIVVPTSVTMTATATETETETLSLSSPSIHSEFQSRHRWCCIEWRRWLVECFIFLTVLYALEGLVQCILFFQGHLASVKRYLVSSSLAFTCFGIHGLAFYGLNKTYPPLIALSIVAVVLSLSWYLILFFTFLQACCSKKGSELPSFLNPHLTLPFRIQDPFHLWSLVLFLFITFTFMLKVPFLFIFISAYRYMKKTTNLKKHFTSL